MKLKVYFIKDGKLSSLMCDGFSDDPSKDLKKAKLDTSLEISLGADRRSTILAVVK